ncbi:hypothetical protein J6590_072547 [Homalodisca vitripennis]|nr:hypothetical protein J6590_072547 [Homalodisca vitripennis]
MVKTRNKHIKLNNIFDHEASQLKQAFLEVQERYLLNDDTVLLLSEKHSDMLEVRSSVSLNMAMQYCHSNSLVVNEDKPNNWCFARKETKYTPHIDNPCCKLSSSLYAFKRIKSISSTRVAKIAYHTIFELHLRYRHIILPSLKRSLPTWGPSSSTCYPRQPKEEVHTA